MLKQNQLFPCWYRVIWKQHEKCVHGRKFFTTNVLFIISFRPYACPSLYIFHFYLTLCVLYVLLPLFLFKCFSFHVSFNQEVRPTRLKHIFLFSLKSLSICQSVYLSKSLFVKYFFSIVLFSYSLFIKKKKFYRNV